MNELHPVSIPALVARRVPEPTPGGGQSVSRETILDFDPSPSAFWILRAHALGGVGKSTSVAWTWL